MVYSAVNGLWPSFFTEMFDARVRYTGFAIGTQIGFLLAGFAPSIGFAIMSEGVAGWVPVAIFAAACGLVSAVGAFTAGRPTAPRSGTSARADHAPPAHLGGWAPSAPGPGWGRASAGVRSCRW